MQAVQYVVRSAQYSIEEEIGIEICHHLYKSALINARSILSKVDDQHYLFNKRSQRVVFLVCIILAFAYRGFWRVRLQPLGESVDPIPICRTKLFQ